MSELVRYEAARRALSEAVMFDEVKAIMDSASASAVLASESGDAAALAQASEIVLRAERRMGEFLIQAKRDAADWVAEARRQFVPSQRSACAVCGKYKSLTQAHHVVPLSIQALHTSGEPNHDHVWLCPTHHVAVHVLIEQSLSSRDRASRATIAILAEVGAQEIEPLLRIMRLAHGGGSAE